MAWQTDPYLQSLSPSSQSLCDLHGIVMPSSYHWCSSPHHSFVIPSLWPLCFFLIFMPPRSWIIHVERGIKQYTPQRACPWSELSNPRVPQAKKVLASRRNSWMCVDSFEDSLVLRLHSTRPSVTASCLIHITAYRQLGTASLNHPRVWPYDLARFYLILLWLILFYGLIVFTFRFLSRFLSPFVLVLRTIHFPYLYFFLKRLRIA